jgi:hypothetical protein
MSSARYIIKKLVTQPVKALINSLANSGKNELLGHVSKPQTHTVNTIDFRAPWIQSEANPAEKQKMIDESCKRTFKR